MNVISENIKNNKILGDLIMMGVETNCTSSFSEKKIASNEIYSDNNNFDEESEGNDGRDSDINNN